MPESLKIKSSLFTQTYKLIQMLITRHKQHLLTIKFQKMISLKFMEEKVSANESFKIMEINQRTMSPLKLHLLSLKKGKKWINLQIFQLMPSKVINKILKQKNLNQIFRGKIMSFQKHLTTSSQILQRVLKLTRNKIQMKQ